MSKIVVLDGYTASPLKPGEQASGNEADWQPLEQLGELVVHERTPTSDIAATIGDATAVITNKAPIDEQTLAQCPGLKYVGVSATGVNIVDLDAARSHGVTVTNVPGYSTASVAQHVFALLFELCNRIGSHDAAVHAGDWASCEDFSFRTGPLVELHNKSLGIVGMGAIGQAVAKIGHALGMTILAHSRTEKDIGLPVKWLGVDELFRQSDAITLHCPLTEQTDRLVNAERLAAMKPSAYLINTGRGPLIDEPALAQALVAGEIAGAGLDVLSSEPPEATNLLLAAPNCVITPHIAWATAAARRRLIATVADNLLSFLEGQPQNVVS